jgi:hypothetical protein
VLPVPISRTLHPSQMVRPSLVVRFIRNSLIR